MQSLDWNNFTRKTDWNPIFNWFVFILALLLVVPIDAYLRAGTHDSYGFLALCLLIPLPAYFLFFIRTNQKAILILAILNAICFFITLVHTYTELLAPLVQNLGGSGIVYTMIFQIYSLFGCVFHAVMIKKVFN